MRLEFKRPRGERRVKELATQLPGTRRRSTFQAARRVKYRPWFCWATPPSFFVLGRFPFSRREREPKKNYPTTRMGGYSKPSFLVGPLIFKPHPYSQDLFEILIYLLFWGGSLWFPLIRHLFFLQGSEFSSQVSAVPTPPAVFFGAGLVDPRAAERYGGHRRAHGASRRVERGDRVGIA